MPDNKQNAEKLKLIFSENLRHYMKDAGIKTADLARTLGYSFTTVSDWVNGRKYPRMDKVQQIADYFGIMKSNLTEENANAPDAMQTIAAALGVEPRELSGYDGSIRVLASSGQQDTPLLELEQLSKLKSTLERIAKIFPADDKLEWALSRLNNAGKNKVADYAMDLTQIPDYQTEQPPVPDSDTATAEKT